MKQLLRSLVLIALFTQVRASEVHVSSIAALQAAVNSASAGDILILDNGTYLNTTLTIAASNITVKAATPGGVSLNGTNAITITGSYVTFSGFQFTSGSITGIVITVSGNHNVVTQLSFKGYIAQKYINLQGQYDDVMYCSFENKPASAPQGNLIHIAPNGIVPNYARIRYCSFTNMPGVGGDNGNECIRIANGAQSAYACRSVVEFCYFENTGMGDSECISNKSRENVIRYNTFRNNQEAMLCFRNGDDCAAYGNFFINAGGIRVKEANNIYCYNNYFEGSGATGSQGCIRYTYYTANTLNVLNNINFIHNTFVNCGVIDFDKGAVKSTWANNLLTKTTGAIFTATDAAGVSWAGNMYQGTTGLALPSGMKAIDPKLVLNADWYYGLSASSPAIDASTAGYPSLLSIAAVDADSLLLLDIAGRSRPAAAALKDVGCEEYGAAGSAKNHPLKQSDVGASYMGGPATSAAERDVINGLSSPVPAFALSHAYPNPFNPATTLRYSIPAAGHVRLVVYDMLGREAALLVDAMQTAGSHEIRWEATGCASGAYVCRLQAGRRSETTTVLLTR